MYSGEIATVNGSFTVKVPNGWTASISNGASFLAIMFARPNEINSLAYNPDTPPIIDPSGIASWNGLTEHFFVTSPSEARKFNSADHLEVSSEPFTFDDSHVGEKYFVVKRAAEAQQWGGLQKDAEWHGRTYIYDNGSKRIEAHLALYPSATIDIDFFEKVIRTIQPI